MAVEFTTPHVAWLALLSDLMISTMIVISTIFYLLHIHKRRYLEAAGQRHLWVSGERMFSFGPPHDSILCLGTWSLKAPRDHGVDLGTQ